MHIRERGHIVQCIRTKYDPVTKKGKNEIVGRLSKANPQITDQLKAALTSSELKDVNAWIESHASVEQLKKELAVRTLSTNLALAEDWFANHKGDEAHMLAESLVPALMRLRSTLRKNGFLE